MCLAPRYACATIATLGEMDNNLHYMRSEPPLLAPIFRSDMQARLLASVLLSDDELTLAQAAERAATPNATAHREVGRLLGAGILTERSIGRARLLAANPDSPLVEPLRRILSVVAGPVHHLTRELSAIEHIDVAFIYGSFAARATGHSGPSPNDINVMVIGDPDADAVYAACERVEGRVGRPVKATILSAAEVESERSGGFLRQIAEQPRLPLIGEGW